MERWSSRTGFLLAAVGAAVGLGNIWRFSAVVGQNGGGAYLVPYLAAAFLFAVPLLALELAVGRDLRTDVVSAFGSIRREFTPVGWVLVGSVALILSYYLVLTGWVLAFLVSAVGGEEIAFGSFTTGHRPVVYFVGAALVTGGVVSLGVRNGIERLSRFVVPGLAVLLAGLAVYAATLPGFDDALGFLFTPETAVLDDPSVWGAAVGQVFFSLSVGQGIMMTFGGYMDGDADLLSTSVTIAVADVAVAIVAGLVIFPIVFTVGAAPTVGTELAFTTLPAAFASMPAGRLVGVAFFGALAVAALTSAVALLEVVVAAVIPATGLDRRDATMGTTGVVVLLGLPSALSYSAVELQLAGRPVLDVMDETVGTYGLPVTAFAIVVAFLWFQPHEVVRRRLPNPGVRALLAYVVPVVLAVVTGLRFASTVPVDAWGLLVGRPPVSRPVAVAAMAVVLVGLAVLGIYLARTLRSGADRESP